MKKGIIIILISLISILIGLNNIKASTVENWTLGLDGLNEVYMYDCTSNNSCTNSISVDSFNVYGTDRYYVNTTGTQPPLVYTNGILMQVSESKTYMPGYLYSVNMYVCTSSYATTPTRTLYSTTWADRTTGISTDTYNSVTNVYSMNNQPFSNTDLTFYSCHSVSSIFSPSKNTTSIIYRFKTPNQSQRIDFSIIGLKVENLGVYDKSLVNQIDEIIDNSGYATAESVEEVNQAVNKVQQEVQELNNAQQETNNILTGEQNYNKDASEEVNGQEEIDDYTEKEEELFSSLNFEGIGNNEITINPNTSSFIWGIIERLRGMNGKIVLLITSVLGLGIIKMILNR